jgi:hypothetical protein
MSVDVGGVGSTQGLRVAKPVKKPTVRHSTRRVSSGGSSGGYSGGSSRRSSGSGNTYSRSYQNSNSGGSSGSYTPPKPKAPPKPPSIGTYLGTDAAYQQAVRGGKRSLADYLSDIGRRRGEAGTQYKQTRGSMERDRVQQLEDLRNEFASRGLIQSGLYGQEQGDFQKKFGEQLTALDQQQQALLADLLGQQKNYQRENDLAMEQAKQEALARRSQKYKIGA